mmetsp:Transcript_7278/g.10932  ORF Transcript_7278/g.10932 Transcript_7278/m.10932 type:complete len:235 (+) Transcript_7278:170-874(+)
MAVPSKVDVPRPSSSRMARECGVAWCRMLAVSDSSTKKVDCPARIRSMAPRRVKMRSTGLSTKDSQGTKQPSCAMMTARHVCLSSVLFPPMLGPLRSRQRALASSAPLGPRLTVLGMTSPPEKVACRQGCLPSTRRRNPGSPGPTSSNCGQQYPGCADTSARASRASRRARQWKAVDHTSRRRSNFSNTARIWSFFAASMLSSACSSFPSILRMSGVQNRFQPFLRDLSSNPSG